MGCCFSKDNDSEPQYNGYRSGGGGGVHYEKAREPVHQSYTPVQQPRQLPEKRAVPANQEPRSTGKPSVSVPSVSVPARSPIHVVRSDTILGKPFEEVKQHYSLGKELGRGQFGVTYLCTENLTGRHYACKSISKRKLVNKNDKEDIKREIK